MNPVLILSRNTRELTQRCVESCLAQDCGDVLISLIDNDSSDGSYEWAKSIPHPRTLMQFRPQIGVSAGWNVGLRNLFEDEGADHVLVCNSDTVLPEIMYSALLERVKAWGAKFVTGISVSDNPPPRLFIPREPAEGPDFSCFLITKECWERIGRFDENLVHYCGDLDYHLRAWRQGIHLFNTGYPFFHERSSTLRMASPKDRRAIGLQADADRETFRQKWNLPPGGPKFAAAFSPETFGIDNPAIQELRDQ